MPPTNHFANGSSHSQIVCHSVLHVDQLGRLLGPEALVVLVRLVVEVGVDDERVALELGGGGNVRCLGQQVVDRRWASSLISVASRRSRSGTLVSPASDPYLMTARPRRGSTAGGRERGRRRRIGRRDRALHASDAAPGAAYRVTVATVHVGVATTCSDLGRRRPPHRRRQVRSGSQWRRPPRPTPVTVGDVEGDQVVGDRSTCVLVTSRPALTVPVPGSTPQVRRRRRRPPPRRRCCRCRRRRRSAPRPRPW